MPFKLGTAGDSAKPWTAEWTTPGPSPLPWLHVPIPLMQLENSTVVVLKLAVNKLGAIVKLTGLSTDGFVLTIMSQALNGSIWATFAWEVMVDPAGTGPCWLGLMYRRLRFAALARGS